MSHDVELWVLAGPKTSFASPELVEVGVVHLGRDEVWSGGPSRQSWQHTGTVSGTQVWDARGNSRLGRADTTGSIFTGPSEQRDQHVGRFDDSGRVYAGNGREERQIGEVRPTDPAAAAALLLIVASSSADEEPAANPHGVAATKPNPAPGISVAAGVGTSIVRAWKRSRSQKRTAAPAVAEPTFEALAKALFSLDREVGRAAARQLALHSDSRSLPILADAIAQGKLGALAALAAVPIAGEAITDAVCAAYPTSNPNARTSILQAVALAPSPAGEQIALAGTRDDDNYVRIFAVRALGKFASQASIDQLERLALIDDGWGVSVAAIESLFALRGPIAHPVLIAASERPDPSYLHTLRLAIAVRLGSAGTAESIGALARLRHDPMQSVRDAAEESLRTIGTPGALQVLEQPGPHQPGLTYSKGTAPERRSSRHAVTPSIEGLLTEIKELMGEQNVEDPDAGLRFQYQIGYIEEHGLRVIIDEQQLLILLIMEGSFQP